MKKQQHCNESLLVLVFMKIKVIFFIKSCLKWTYKMYGGMIENLNNDFALKTTDNQVIKNNFQRSQIENELNLLRFDL